MKKGASKMNETKTFHEFINNIYNFISKYSVVNGKKCIHEFQGSKQGHSAFRRICKNHGFAFNDSNTTDEMLKSFINSLTKEEVLKWDAKYMHDYPEAWMD